ncbi:IS481 family transposase [Burkholderia multivorans]|uniref:IS481 family transposase n=1 Tax=Burkholderia multivorans TaxID=87883 RepID=UPI0020A1CEBE|nr:IS481 family transposase [Burkholderia multivorans]MCO8319752.1 IS481 family transposase [Burkholderia multivorans]MCO8429869.1 IS481 family transposase [Burkholderia multivorans]MCO8441279.1 IS481 family transposase [Burkholderia multivorans]MCO8547391.1 IS481 family transposase [Burkholderia multivorans]MCO8553375.1 IS481 family transposase [Burkholderia multivorans]
MDRETAARLRWVRMYHETGNAGLVCARCGISRPTLRKWLRRYQEAGEAGLQSQSRRPLRSPNRKVSEADRATVLRLRAERKGARRIQNELRLHEQRELSLATIHKVLSEAGVKPLVRSRRPTQPKRYSRPVPGDRVQMDTMKIARGAYQYTAIDDCSRFRVLAIYPRRNARNTLLFLDRVIEEMPFPIQRIQTDRGDEFFAESVQRRLMSECIKFRPIPPRSPHLNGKVERSQLTDLNEFWSDHPPTGDAIDQRIEEWQFNYNWRRPHGSLGGKTPIDRIAELSEITPLAEEVESAYDETKERIRHREWRVDKTLAEHHRRVVELASPNGASSSTTERKRRTKK